MTKVLEWVAAKDRTDPGGMQGIGADHVPGGERQEAPQQGKWRQVAERLARLDLLRGRSGEFRRHVREFRDTFEAERSP